MQLGLSSESFVTETTGSHDELPNGFERLRKLTKIKTVSQATRVYLREECSLFRKLRLKMANK